jgi:hypothetical protein
MGHCGFPSRNRGLVRVDPDGVSAEAWIPNTLRSFQSLTRSGMTVPYSAFPSKAKFEDWRNRNVKLVITDRVID